MASGRYLFVHMDKAAGGGNLRRKFTRSVNASVTAKHPDVNPDLSGPLKDARLFIYLCEHLK